MASESGQTLIHFSSVGESALVGNRLLPEKVERL
jgi:hypothetical protein